jgi:hypothetical protein
MKCRHCLVEIHAREVRTEIGYDIDGSWQILSIDCPSCSKMNLFLVNAEDTGNYLQHRRGKVKSTVPIWPRGSTRSPCPPEVPVQISEDYVEASIVLPDSPKASAALSRRCLQNLLREAAKVRPGNLADEIQQVIESKSLPSHLAEAIDAVRNIGNFAAHPLKSQSTGQIHPVEPEEAEWNLDVLESLFDFYYVQPTILAKKRAALNSKLSDAGKKPMK